tara:strand:- start:3126 stop:3401 length:276 start_codon:yes stop_codon:yes gene_type:complete
MQRCPRAFVLRYGIAAYAADHPTGQMLKDSFEIQTPWILMQMSIRETIRDNLEQVPFADSSRACTYCSVRFLCPAKDGLEEAKMEQMSLMC